MNNNYWDEYIKYYIDDEFKKKLIKFHLSSDMSIFGNRLDIPDILYKEWLNKQKTLKYPDTKISYESFETVDKPLQEILDILHKFISKCDIITFLPIISVQKNPNKILNYGINLDTKSLILYSEGTSDFMRINNLLYTISYFMNIDEGLLLYHTEAYVKSILQIGYVKNNLENIIRKKYVLKDCIEAKQKWINNLDINPNMELLIATTNLGI